MTIAAAVFAALLLTLEPQEGAGSAREAPAYNASSIVNSADGQAGPLAPNAIASLYGSGLAYATKALTPDDIHGGILPTVLPGTGVRLLVGGLPANIYYVSPTQINFLVPPNLLPGHSDIQEVIDGLSGPLIPIQLAAASPALFQLDSQNVIAVRADGSLIKPEAPAQPGDTVIVYATGLGQTVPPVVYGQLPTAAAPLKQIADFRILLDGTAVNFSSILYAGIAPFFAGLYQVNLQLPQSTAPNPEIRIGFSDTLSKPGLHLPMTQPASRAAP